MEEGKCIFEPSKFMIECEKKQERDVMIVCMFAYSLLLVWGTYLVTKVFGL